MKLQGVDLLEFVSRHTNLTISGLCLATGYDENIEEFLAAKIKADKEHGPYIDQEKINAAWYNSLTDTQRDLYDAMEDTCPEFSMLDAEQCQEFMDELSELGITTAEQFEDQYFYQSDSHNAQAEFAEYLTTEVNALDLDKAKEADYVVVIDGAINWQQTWDSALCYDFTTIEFNDETYFFSNDPMEVN